MMYSIRRRTAARSEILEKRTLLAGLPTVQFQAAALSPAESIGVLNLNVTLSAASGSDVIVPFTVGGTASNPADYTIAASPLTIPAGMTSVTLPVSIVNDTLDEPNETVVITLGTPTGATVGTNGVHTMTIADNDLPPGVRFVARNNSIGEADDAFAPTVELTAVSAFNISVPIVLGLGSTATFDTDYTFVGDTIMIPAGQLSGSATAFNVVNDGLVEQTETVVLSFGTPTNATATSPSILVVNIIDDDVAPTVIATDFQVLTAPQRVLFQFSTDVSASLSVSDVVVKNLNAEMHIPTSAIALSYDTQTNTAAFTFPGLPNGALPDGNYRARIRVHGVSDPAGNTLQFDGVASFYALNGDATRDRAVNLDDFSRLASNFNKPGNYGDGDFNYSGTVEIGDFSILASRFNTTRPAPVAPAMYPVQQVPNPVSPGLPYSRSDLFGEGISDNGTVIGRWSWSLGSTSKSQAYQWTTGQSQISAGAENANPNAISNAGVVGSQQFSGFGTAAYGPGGILGDPDASIHNGMSYFANDINDLGNVVGGDSSGGFTRGIRWLGGPGSYEEIISNGQLNGINNLGEMVGQRSGNIAFYIPAGSTAPQTIVTPGSAQDINDSSKVLGSTNSLPYTWRPGGTVFNLEPFGTAVSGSGDDINNAGLVVGYSNSSLGAFPVVWYEGLPYDLRTLIPSGAPAFKFATAINNLGQIVVTDELFGKFVWVLTPIPGSGPTAPPAMARETLVKTIATEVTPSPQPMPAAKSAGVTAFSNRLIEQLDLLAI